MEQQQIREVPMPGTSTFEGISKFMFCFSDTKYRKSCCCGLFTLRASIYIFAIIDIVYGSISALSLLLESDRGEYYEQESRPSFYIVHLINALVALPATLAIHGAARTDAKKISYYYYAKVAQMLLLPLPRLIESQRSCRAYTCTSGEFVIFLIFLAVTTVVLLYQAHILFSYVNLVCHGETVLANNGQDVVQAMDQYRRQAAALDLQPNAVVVGAPVATPLAQVKVGEVVA